MGREKVRPHGGREAGPGHVGSDEAVRWKYSGKAGRPEMKLDTKFSGNENGLTTSTSCFGGLKVNLHWFAFIVFAI
jgi:hypothetical protein